MFNTIKLLLKNDEPGDIALWYFIGVALLYKITLFGFYYNIVFALNLLYIVAST